MRNLILHQTHLQSILNTNPIAYYIDEFSKVVVILDTEMKIRILTYENSDIFSNFIIRSEIDLEEILSRDSQGMEILNNLTDFIMNTTETIDMNNSPIKLFLYKNEEDSVHIIIDSGIYININTQTLTHKCLSLTENGKENGVRILSAEISPNLENILIISSDFQITLLNYDFEFLMKSELDDGDGSDIIIDNSICKQATSTWRGDSQFFAVLYSINSGKKCLVRDTKLKVVKGPARADNKVVFSMAEGPIHNLSNVLSWQPSGSLIAYFQENTIDTSKVNDTSLKSGVLFSEKNCLRHGEFWLDQNLNNLNEKITAKFLKWNLDLPMLVIYFDSLNLVNIYIRSNYDWSLKYSFSLKSDEKIFSLKFSDHVSLRLIMLLTNGNFQSIDFKLEYQNSSHNYNFADHNGTVAVINGNKIKLTPLGEVNIPPPFALETLSINEIRLPPYIIQFWRNFIFVLSDNGIDYIQINHGDKTNRYNLININQTFKFDTKFVKNFVFSTNDENTQGYFVINKIIPNDDHHDELLILNFEINLDNKNLNFLNLLSTSTHIIKRCLVIFNSILSEGLYDKDFYKNKNIIEIENKSENEKIVFDKNEADDLFYGLVGLNSNKNKENNLLEKNTTNNKFIYVINYNDIHKEKSFAKLHLDNTSDEIDINIEEINIHSKFDIIKSQAVMTYENEERIIYMTKNNRLLMDNTLLALDVTSFEYFKHFLIFTQTSNTPYNTLHIIDLNKKDFLLAANNHQLTKMENMGNNTLNIPNPQTTPLVTHTESLFIPNFNYKTFTIRTIERSSLIVTVSKVNLVLQMQRGNLETIYPRLLVLNLIIELVRVERNYKEAFELLRKHKINTNFIYDVDPEGFFLNLPKFLSQLERSDYINLFLNGLENSISEEMLQLDPDLNTKEDFKKLFVYNKVNKVCDEMRKELVIINKDNKYLTSILHSHTKKTPQESLQALKLVQSLKIEEKNKTNDKNKFSADKALEYLCWVVNADTLFDFALKTYDFELVIMVAKFTQKDPKEFLPYLKKLQDLSQEDPILMKYQINIDLKMFDDALFELSAGQEKYFDKCLELITKYELYELAFSLFYNDINLFQNIYQHYADYLKLVKKDTQEAAWAYLKSTNYKSALECFMQVGNVNEVLTILNQNENHLLNDVKIFEILSELIDTCASAKKYSELEKLYLFINENEEKLKNLSEDHVTHNLLNIQFKLMDGLMRSKKWKSAYLLYTNLLSKVNNYSNLKSSITIQDVLKEFKDGLTLSTNLQLNELKKNLNLFEEKYNRLLKVQHLKRTQPHLFILDLGDKNLEDNVSDSGSVTSSLSKNSGARSKKSSMSSMSKGSKRTKKSKMKISLRKIKEGSPLEEEYLIEVLTDLKLSNENIESIRELIRVLNFMKNFSNVSDCDELSKILNLYVETVNKTCSGLLLVSQKDFIDAHPEIRDLFPGLNLNEILSNAFKKQEGVGIKIFTTTN